MFSIDAPSSVLPTRTSLSRSLALGVESKVKKLSKDRKEELIRDNTHIDEIIKLVRS